MSIFTGLIENETAEDYHSKREYISSSPLPEMAKSPLHFFTAWTAPTEATDAMERGSFIHKIVLEQDIARYVARPLNEKGELVRSNSKEYAAWLAQHPGQTPIHPDLYNEASAILNSVCQHTLFLKAFEGSLKEASFYATHKGTGLPIKGRPDMIAKDRSFILDVKTTSDITRFERQIFALGYDVRLVHYAVTAAALESWTEPPEFYFFAVESKAPYGTRMYRLKKDAVLNAYLQHDTWMNEIATCHQDATWPGFSQGIVDVERPKFLEVESAPVFEGVG